jgi:phosphoribosylglycinamide formyltransferase-1
LHRIGIFASHNGTNLQAIIDACNDGSLQMTPAVVVSNNSDSLALQRARTQAIPAYHLSSYTHTNPAELDQAIRDVLLRHSVDLVVLAGYMRKLGAATLASFRNRVLNIHPALLPKYGGKDMYGIKVHQAVIASEEAETGVSVHLVDEKYDHGRIISQIRIKVPQPCTAEELQALVLTQENVLYVSTLRRIAEGSIAL